MRQPEAVLSTCQSDVAPFAAARDNAESADEMTLFARAVSHDFSGPLRTIRGFASLLADRADGRVGDEEPGYLDEIIVAAARMQALNDGLVSCVRTRNAILAFTQVSLDSVFNDCIEDLGTRITRVGGRVSASPLPVVWADAAAMRLVLHHLLDNALRYAGVGRAPTIRVTASRGSDEWTIVVRDDGPGIAAVSRGHVFAMFKRLEPGSEPGRPGVGLTLCRTIVQRHGGRVWIDAVHGGGAEVAFSLPRKAAAAAGVPSSARFAATLSCKS